MDEALKFFPLALFFAAIGLFAHRRSMQMAKPKPTTDRQMSPRWLVQTAYDRSGSGDAA